MTQKCVLVYEKPVPSLSAGLVMVRRWKLAVSKIRGGRSANFSFSSGAKAQRQLPTLHCSLSSPLPLTAVINRVSHIVGLHFVPHSHVTRIENTSLLYMDSIGKMLGMGKGGSGLVSGKQRRGCSHHPGN